MALSREDKLLLRRMNKRMERFKKAGADNYIIGETKNMLLNFYMKYDIDAPRSGRFTTRELSNPEAQEEILKIARAMDRVKSSNIGYYKRKGEEVEEQQLKSFQTSKEAYGAMVQDLPSYMEFIDEMENIDKGFKEYYDNSKEIARIYDYGYEVGLSSKEIQKIMKRQVGYGRKTPREIREERTIMKINKYIEQDKSFRKRRKLK